MSRVVRRDCSGRTYDIVAQTTRSAAATKLSYLDVSACVLHLHDKRCSLGIHESLLMIVTSFALRSPCSWQLQCEMYVLQFYLNLFSVVLAQLRLTLRCRCIDASTSAPPHLSTCSSSHAHVRRSTSPLHHTHTSICTSRSHLYIHTVTPSHLSCLSFFLHIFSLVTSSHAHIHRSTCTPPHIYTFYIAPAHPHCHSFTSTLSFSLSIYLFDSAGQSHVSLSGHPSSSCFFSYVPSDL